MAHPATARERSVRGERLYTTWKRCAGSVVPWLRHSGRARPPATSLPWSQVTGDRVAGCTAKSNNAARGDMVSVMAGNSPPRTDTPSDVIVAKTESDAARMSGWARALGYPDPSTRMIASATTITSTSVVSHSGMRLVGSGIASALRNPDAATESRAPI